MMHSSLYEGSIKKTNVTCSTYCTVRTIDKRIRMVGWTDGADEVVLQVTLSYFM